MLLGAPVTECFVGHEQALPDKYRDLFCRLMNLMENKQNYKQYRAVLASPPAEEFSGTLPYIGTRFWLA